MGGKSRRSSVTILSDDAARMMATLATGFEADMLASHMALLVKQEAKREEAAQAALQARSEQVRGYQCN